MNKSKFLLLGIVVILILLGWFAYQKATDDTYEGMSIIPEQHKDIPLFDGLKPSRSHYEIKGNRWEDIYHFYMNELPKLGWEFEHEQTALDDDNYENDWSGFYLLWRKDGFIGELRISASYNHYDEITKVIFDKTPIYKSTSWIEEIPDSICIYETLKDEKCFEVNDQSKIKQIKYLINNATDWAKEELPQREKTSVVDFGNLEITVSYESDKEIYFQSEKGIKIMKPEPEFFELTNLPH
ncbi:hypothetical protein M3181_20400 [Mesobacillus maritimus]|uniref:hypothetical protein n=1 Tax=Mesobacillus maritimus TaxID=1643336 RepID=UPI00203B7C4E|nr:hypothetical protein [Mesobacillus maritimus]MCM3671324.1 hypothetical protein [Mesobacillus maritimus]